MLGDIYNGDKFKRFLLEEGINKRVAANIVSRIKRINLIIQGHYHQPISEATPEQILIITQRFGRDCPFPTGLPVGKPAMNAYQSAVKWYLKFIGYKPAYQTLRPL